MLPVDGASRATCLSVYLDAGLTRLSVYLDAGLFHRTIPGLQKHLILTLRRLQKSLKIR